MRHENVTFANTRGQKLAGRIELPLDGEPLAYALYAHCFTCNKDLKAIHRITETLALHGIATLRFDFTGLGDSEGDFSNTNFSTSVADLMLAADFLEQNYGNPELLIGHSLGGAVALAAGSLIDSIQAVVTLAAPAGPKHIEQHIVHDLEQIQEEGAAEVMLGGRPVTIRKQLLEDIDNIRLERAIAQLGRPLLVIHSPDDDVVSIDNATEILSHAKHPKSFLSLDGADHLVTVDADARYVAGVVASWSGRYTSGDLTVDAQPDFLEDAPESVTIARIEDGFQTDIVSNGFSLIADEPESVGGTNTGPTPYDYLLTALGSCTAMTLRMYADRKEWPLETATIRLTHRKVHANDCAECETEAGHIDRIDRRIELTGDLDEEQRQRLMEIADRCPVHKTLHGEVVVDNQLAASG